MGDRCYLQVTVRQGDVEQICEFLGEPDEREDDNVTAMLTYHEANYGFGNPLDDVATAGIEFFGWHGTGSSYDAADFCSWNKTVVWIYTGNEGGYIIIGDTPEERRGALERLEQCVNKMKTMRQKINNPLCALALEANDNG